MYDPKLLSALSYLDVAKASRDEWLKVGMALNYEGYPVEVWIWWSENDPRFHPGECEKIWSGFHGSTNPVTGRTIYKLARSRGWNPNNGSHKSGGSQNAAPTEAYAEDLILYLEALFRSDDIIGYVTNDVFQGGDGKFHPSKGVYTRSAGEIVKELKQRDDIGAVIGDWNPQAGAWIHINPLDGHGTKDSNVIDFRYALIESDNLSIQKQKDAYLKLRLPIAAMVYSGGKSLHAVVRVDAPNAQIYKERVSYLYSVLTRNGITIDTQNKNPARMSRMPGVTRNEVRQSLVDVNVGCTSWDDWKSFIECNPAPEINEQSKEQPKLFKSLDNFEEQQARWIVRRWIPEGQITVVAAEGGTGKTAFWVNLLAGLSSGNPTVLDIADGNDFGRESMKTAFFSTEDSVTKKLLKSLREAGANLSNIVTMDLSEDKENRLRDFKFGSDYLAQIIREIRPAVCVFDPIQGFIPANLNMGSRNAMRDCLAQLIELGEECGTAFIIICHTNKRRGVSGRARLADSSDIWDIARSVIMAGYTKNRGIRYLSHEKSNYSSLQASILYRIDDCGRFQIVERSEKRDADFVAETFEGTMSRSKPKQDGCEDLILRIMENSGGDIAVKQLENLVIENGGYSEATLKRAKQRLEIEGKIKLRPKEKHGPWFATLVEQKNNDSQDTAVDQVENSLFIPLPDDTLTPWDRSSL